MRTRIAVSATLALVLAAFGGSEVAPVAAATPLVTMTISQSPTIGAQGAPVTYTGTVTPVGGTSHNVMVGMQAVTGAFNGGTCEPACEGFNPSWTFPTLSSKTTVTFTTQVWPGRKVTFFLLGGTAGCSGTCPPSVTQIGPTLTTSGSWTSSGQVVAGQALHLTVRAGTNAGPIQGILQVELPSGVDAPTNLPAGADYVPSSHRVEALVTLANDASYSFDAVVNAPSPSTLSFTINFRPSSDGSIPYSHTTLSVHVGPDSTKPTATGPTVSLASGTALSGGLVPVRVAWSGADAGSGIDHYELGQSTDGHTYTVVDAALGGGVTYRYLAASHTYRFLARAVDHAGNVGAWTSGSTFTLTADSEATTAIKYGGTWSSSSSTLYRGSKARSTSVAGRTATRTFTGKSIAWLALKGPARGKATVYIDGVLSATVDLYASVNQGQRLVWAKAWTTSKSHTLVIKVSGTSGRPSVNLDGLIIIR